MFATVVTVHLSVVPDALTERFALRAVVVGLAGVYLGSTVADVSNVDASTLLLFGTLDWRLPASISVVISSVVGLIQQLTDRRSDLGRATETVALDHFLV